jgi:hypothetical protein
MKTTISKMLIIFILLSSVLNIGAAPAKHRLIKTPFTGTEIFVSIPDPNPGTVTVKDGKTIYKGFVQYMYDDMTDARVTGDFRAELDAVFDNDTGAGPFLASIQITNANGSWTVHAVGYINADGTAWACTWGYGQGDYQGMTAFWKYTSPDRMFSSTVEGYILENK